MSTDTLRAACNDLINLYAQFELPHCWGSGESAAADGTLLETYEENLFAAHHVRYGRTGGIAYRHVADTYIALFSHFIPCGVHEAVYILDGLLKNTSDVQPRRLHADTHGQSTTVFGLAYLLGIELMPRIRNWRSLKFYRTGVDGHPLYTRSLYSGTIDWDLIHAHWEDYLRVVLAIQSGHVSASWVLARLNRYSRRNRLYLAFQELGRVVRTVYLLRWIGNDALRACVTDGANKVETFHEFSDFLNFGSQGVLKTNDPDEQEKLTVYNQLVANAVMV
jgi:TnpA family transposase